MGKFFKKHKGLTAFLIIAIIAVLLVVYLQQRAKAAVVAVEPDTMTLQLMDIEQLVTATGTVRASATKQVTTTYYSPVDVIYVELGEVVEEDQRLCRLESGTYIYAPMDGTVTAINAVKGERAGTLPLFVVEDLAHLEVVANVPEYDMVMLEVGMPVRIGSDALEGSSWQGEVKSISPVAIDNAGNFQIIVTVTTESGKLTGGMSARLNIICDSKESVFAVPYDAVVENESGQKVVYAYVPATEENPESSRREIVVSTGLETDYYIEISGDGLTEGLVVLTDPEGRNVVETNSFLSLMGR